MDDEDDPDEPGGNLRAVEISQIIMEHRGFDAHLPWSETLTTQLNRSNQPYLYYRTCHWCREYVVD
eukprot:8022-Amphidinium_carterae.1